jgi:hypothetical protein
MGEWKPIDTAPRDGTWIVLGKANWLLFPKAKWGPFGPGEDGPFDGWLFAEEHTPCIVPNVDGEPFLGWQEDIDDANMPTHWMPLPPEDIAL